MAGSPVAIGPWNGGLNIREDPRLIADNQLAECINFDVGRAGELTIRTGLKVAGTPDPVAVTILASLPLTSVNSILYLRTLETTPRILYSRNPLAGTSETWKALGSTAAKTTLAVVLGVDAVNTTTPYAWFIPHGSAAVGVRHNLVSDVVESVTAMPRGSGGIVFKSRLFIWGAMTSGAGTQRIYYSAVGDFTSWPANNFFDVGPGDGETVSALAIQGDTLFIFKSASTWALYFDTDPFLGSLRKVNNEIGVTTPQAVATYQNDLYIISNAGVYRVVNLIFEEISKDLGLESFRIFNNLNMHPDSISVVGSKIVCCIGTTDPLIPYKYYIYFTEIGAWSEYQFGGFHPTRFETHVDTVALQHQYITRRNSNILYHMQPFNRTDTNYGDSPNDATVAMFATKKYAYGMISAFKRIFWWTVEVTGNGKAFTIFATADDELLSAPVGGVADVIRSITKSFTRNRFRTMQFHFRSEEPNTSLTVFSGEANVVQRGEISA